MNFIFSFNVHRNKNSLIPTSSYQVIFHYRLTEKAPYKKIVLNQYCLTRKFCLYFNVLPYDLEKNTLTISRYVRNELFQASRVPQFSETRVSQTHRNQVTTKSQLFGQTRRPSAVTAFTHNDITFRFSTANRNLYFQTIAADFHQFSRIFKCGSEESAEYTNLVFVVAVNGYFQKYWIDAAFFIGCQRLFDLGVWFQRQEER